MAETDDDDLSWDGVSEDMARQILHQGEAYLRAQLDIAIAADQRAVTVASVFVATSTAMMAVALAYWSQTNDLAMLLAGIAASVCMAVGACYGFWASRPHYFFAPGNEPKQWWHCRTMPLVTALGGESENYQFRIDRNERSLAANGRSLNRGVMLAWSAPIVGLAVWVATSLICPL